jgi:hypothetical protein
MHSLCNDILDISYDKGDGQIYIQIVLLKGKPMPAESLNKVKEYLPDWKITIYAVFMSKEEFNENRGEWQPVYYNWLANVLFSKAEVL